MSSSSSLNFVSDARPRPTPYRTGGRYICSPRGFHGGRKYRITVFNNVVNELCRDRGHFHDCDHNCVVVGQILYYNCYDRPGFDISCRLVYSLQH